MQDEQSEKMSLPKRIGGFFNEVGLEAKRSSWPDRKTLVSHTFLVIVSVLMMGLFVGVSDTILKKLLLVLISNG
jgi:preprotein translocase subunit SecE